MKILDYLEGLAVRVVALVTLVLLVVGFSSPAPQACGDKFLVGGSTIPSQIAAVQPAMILVFTNANDDGPDAMFSSDVRAAMEEVGHTVIEVDPDADDLMEALRST